MSKQCNKGGDVVERQVNRVVVMRHPVSVRDRSGLNNQALCVGIPAHVVLPGVFRACPKRQARYDFSKSTIPITTFAADIHD